jgi:hypothetical protein
LLQCRLYLQSDSLSVSSYPQIESLELLHQLVRQLERQRSIGLSLLTQSICNQISLPRMILYV